MDDLIGNWFADLLIKNGLAWIVPFAIGIVAIWYITKKIIKAIKKHRKKEEDD